MVLFSIAFVFSHVTAFSTLLVSWRHKSRSSGSHYVPGVVSVPLHQYNMWPTYKSSDGDESNNNKKNNSEGEKLESIDSKEKIQEVYDVERFRNRATLTQSVLKEKVEEVKLLKSKVLILQNLVQRLGTESERELEKQLKEKEKHNAEVLESLRGEFNKTKQLLEEQAQQQAKMIQTLEGDLAQQKKELSAEVEVKTNINRKLGDQIKALQKEVFDMDQTLETTQGELQTMQRRLVAREDEIRYQDEAHQRKRKSLESRVKELELDRQYAVENATQTEELRQESIQIATAAVEAAAQREVALNCQLEALKTQVLTLQEEKAMLQTQLGDGIADSELKEKISKLEKTIVEEKLANDVRRKVAQEEFEIQLQTERKVYEEELNRLRTRLNKQRTDAPATANMSRRLRKLWQHLRS